MPTSIVRKNSIRDSHQRGIVVHGTNDLVVEENVALSTSGHCFMTEDGMEMGNLFLNNIAISTGPVDKVIPDDGSNGHETDDEASGFWTTNPNNLWIGNVAAGAIDSGFWFDVRLRGSRASQYPDLVPKREKLGAFENNTVHSCVEVSCVLARCNHPMAVSHFRKLLTFAPFCCAGRYSNLPK